MPSITRQSIPTEGYCNLLGVAISVFISNNGFIIENILRNDATNQYTWYDLIDKTSGRLKKSINETITKNSTPEIADLFFELVEQRNRIIHGFRITAPDGAQIIATKDLQNNQFHITEDFLKEFIQKNEELSSLLHKFRGF